MEIIDVFVAAAVFIGIAVAYFILIKLLISETKRRNAKEAAKERFYEKLTERLSE